MICKSGWHCSIIPLSPPLAWHQTQMDKLWLGSGVITEVKYGHKSYRRIHRRHASSHSCPDFKQWHSFWRASAEIVGRWSEPWAQNHGKEKSLLEEKSRSALTIECIFWKILALLNVPDWAHVAEQMKSPFSRQLLASWRLKKPSCHFHHPLLTFCQTWQLTRPSSAACPPTCSIVLIETRGSSRVGWFCGSSDGLSPRQFLIFNTVRFHSLSYLKEASEAQTR